jgi:malonyl-CoA O-methyltransferase
MTKALSPNSGSRPTKARIRQSFERAAASYDSAAQIQRQICQRLAGNLSPITPSRLLDAGSGTGYALPLLQARFPAAQVIALDLSPAMLQQIDTPCCRLSGDLEDLPLAAASVDLYWSSLAVQWCDLAKALREARRVLGDDGHLALASLGPATFHELRHAFAGVDSFRHTLPFHSPREISRLAEAAGFSRVKVESATKIAHYADFKTLLRAVKAVGANQLGDGRRPGLMSRTTFQRAAAAYETLRVSAGLPLTYDVIYLAAQP